jgi:hypothetical protein
MKTEIQEKLIEFAQRIPPGDRWQVMHVDAVQNGLTEALEAYYQAIVTKPKAFRLDLIEGKLYGIFPTEVKIKEPEIKKYNIYGELE